MTLQTEYLTREGYEKFSKELEYLRTVCRAQIAERLRLAVEDGTDMLDNAAFEDAKQEQSFVEGRILYLETLLTQAQILDEDIQHFPPDVVCRNRRVTVQHEGDEPEVFHIVGAAETNPQEGRLSAESPLGQVLLGKRVGEKVILHAPGGTFSYRILAVE